MVTYEHVNFVIQKTLQSMSLNIQYLQENKNLNTNDLNEIQKSLTMLDINIKTLLDYGSQLQKGLECNLFETYLFFIRENIKKNNSYNTQKDKDLAINKIINVFLKETKIKDNIEQEAQIMLVYFESIAKKSLNLKFKNNISFVH